MKWLVMPALVGVLAASSGATADTMKRGQCFLRREFQNFKPVNDHAFNIRVGTHTYFRVELEGQCPHLDRKDAVLISTFRSTGLVCDRLDWDLKVGESGELHFATGCIVKSQTRLTDEQASQIPFNEKP